MAEWKNRQLDPGYPVCSSTASRSRFAEGNVANRPMYVATGDCRWHPRYPQFMAGEHGDEEGVKNWLRVSSELQNLGAQDVLIKSCATVSSIYPTRSINCGHRPSCRLCGPSSPQHLRLGLPQGLGRDRQGPQTDLSRRHRSRPHSTDTQSSVTTGRTLSRDHKGMDQRLGRVRAVPTIRQCHPAGHLHDHAIENVNARIRRAVKACGKFLTEAAA